MTETAKGFKEEHFFLSNFYPSPMVAKVAGVETSFASGEHLFQAYKVETSLITYAREDWVHKFASAPTPGKAKYLGRSIPLNIALWDAHAEVFMKKTIYHKFEQHPDLKQQLIATEDMKLVEYNEWGDKKWGVDPATGVGENLLGQLLMRLRTYYQQ